MAEHLVSIKFGHLDINKQDYIRLQLDCIKGLDDPNDNDIIFDGNFTPEEALRIGVKLFEEAVKYLSREELDDLKRKD